MRSTKFTPSPEQIAGIQHAIEVHGRNAKIAIRDAWMTGTYHSHGLGDFSSPLQTMRNTEGGIEFLNLTSLKAIRSL